MLRYAYNTNGFAHHRLEDAIAILREAGYAGVGLTLDVHHLDPFRATAGEIARARRALDGLEVVIQTGARFLLDPRRKHEPTLLASEPEGRALRQRFLARAVEVGAALGAKGISFWSGAAPAGAREAELWDWLAAGAAAVAEAAAAAGLFAAFEPEPGMWIERCEGFAELRRRVGHPALRLALDVGHLACTGESLPAVLAAHRDQLSVVQIEDIAGGRHEHRMFGEGELDYAAVLGALAGAGFRGCLEVELSRDSHRAPACAAAAIRWLREREPRAARG